MEQIEVFEKLLDEFNTIKDENTYSDLSENYFSVSGYPHYENVASNILQFFFDSRAGHGMKDLWLSSLLECYKEKKEIRIDDAEVISIEREYLCEEQKRIDLLIETTQHIIVIENKIYATLDNPLEIYHRAVERMNEEKILVEIVLSMREEQDQKGFINIRYDDFLDRVQTKVGYYLAKVDYKWIIFMNEFIQNLRRISSYMNNNSSINREWQNFLENNDVSVGKLIETYYNDIAIKHQLLEELHNEIMTEEYALEMGVIDKGCYRAGSRITTGYSSIVMDIPIEDEKKVLVVEPYVQNEYSAKDHERRTSLYVPVWCRKGGLYDFKELIDSLKDEYPNIRTIKGDVWGRWILVTEFDLRNEFDKDAVVRCIKGIIEKVVSLRQ